MCREWTDWPSEDRERIIRRMSANQDPNPGHGEDWRLSPEDIRGMYRR